MSTEPSPHTSGAISFGPFTLVPGERLLTKEGAPVDLGGRTLDTLIALVSHPNEIVSKQDLMAQVWPDVIVEEGSLRFQIAALRKALGDGQDGARYIATLAGRGYCFVAPLSPSIDRATTGAPVVTDFSDAHLLPARLTRMVGRADSLLAVSRQLRASRLVTIAGPGGVGKTTVAVAVAHDLLEEFSGAVAFADFGTLSETEVAGAVASTLGLSVNSPDPTPSLIAYLRDKRFLLVLDNCEHVIGEAAALAARILAAAREVHVLATSREALRVEGEQVYRLTPLVCAPEDTALTSSSALTFPAIQLFVERAEAAGARLDLSDEDLVTVAGICRRLDGIALAIELAAGRVEAYGLQQTATLLDERLSLLWLGKRTAPPRQKTLQATLDWSYELLSETERLVLGRLAVFTGPFTLEAAQEIATTTAINHDLVLDAVESLVAKSMVATNRVGVTMRYRLLDTTRAYVLKIRDDKALPHLAERHAIYYRRWLEQAAGDWSTTASATVRAPNLADLANVRAALDWCFAVNGNTELGIELVCAATSLFLAMSLLTDCHRWCERAILALDEQRRGGPEEMNLQAALGLSLMYTRGNNEAARAALARGLAIAEGRGDLLNQMRLLGQLTSFSLRIGDFKTALHHAERCFALARTMGDPAALALAHSALGSSRLFIGELESARADLDAALRFSSATLRTKPIYPGFDLRSWTDWAGVALARTLWIQGHPARAIELARSSVTDSATKSHPVRRSVALAWAVSLFLWSGDLESAEEHNDWLISEAESHSLTPYVAVGRGYQGDMAIRRGDPARGIESLQSCLEEFRATCYEVLSTPFKLSLIQGLAAIGRFTESTILIDETIALVERNGDLLYMPELLRVKGGVLLASPQASDDAAEACLRQSLEWSRRQGARAWTLRAAVDMAALLAGQGQTRSAREVLQPALDQLPERADTTDLKAAERLLASLG